RGIDDGRRRTSKAQSVAIWSRALARSRVNEAIWRVIASLLSPLSSGTHLGLARWYDHTVDHTGGSMATTERVTVTLPVELIESIDRYERNRSRFIAEAVEHELGRRRREGLLRSLKSPHPEAAELAETGLADWGASLPPDDEGLVDVKAGKPVRWLEGQGWVEESI